MTGCSPTPAQRQAVSRWTASLKSRLRCDATDHREKAVELAKLTSAFPQQGQDQVSSDLRIETFFEALEGMPAWAVREARLQIVNGQTAFGRPWGPGPVEFAELVRGVVKPVQDDLRELAIIEKATALEVEPTATERGFIEQGFEDLKASFGKRSAHRVYEDAMAGLRARAPDVNLDLIPDAPARQGTFSRPSAPLHPKATEAAA